MLTLAAGLGLGAGLIGASVAAQLTRKTRRKERFRGLELKPNCLLTRYPIAFLAGPRSVFRFIDHWNDVPLYLREHGYEVLVIEPSGKTTEERVKATVEAIESFEGRCHLIADASLEAEIEMIAELPVSKLVSLTVVKNSERKAESKTQNGISIADLKPRRSAVEVFELNANGSDFGFSETTPSILELASRALLKCHNFAIRHRSAAVDALETAEFGLFRGFRNEERFLDLAVSLAERDLVGSERR